MDPAPPTVTIRARPRTDCPLCGRTGPLVHERLRDRMGNAPGAWSLRRCPGEECGILWLDPVPLPEDLPLAYREYFTHDAPPARPPSAVRRLALAARRGYHARFRGAPEVGLPGWQRAAGLLPLLYPVWRAELEFRAMHLDAVPGGRLLEVGCGNGDLLAGVRDLGWEVEGVDFDPGAVAAARRRGLAVREGDLASCGFPAGTFDAVVMVHVIEHVPDPRATMAEARRVLKPGGRMVLVTPNPGSRGHGCFGSAWSALEPPRHLHLFPPATLGRLVAGAGFAVERLGTSVRGTHQIVTWSLSIARSGRFEVTAVPGVGDRIRGHLFTVATWLSLLFRPFAGEETVLVARAI